MAIMIVLVWTIRKLGSLSDVSFTYRVFTLADTDTDTDTNTDTNKMGLQSVRKTSVSVLHLFRQKQLRFVYSID